MATYENVKEALSYISPDLERLDWAKIAAGIYSEFGEDGFELFDDWSSKAEGIYDKSTTRSCWKSSKKLTKVGIGSLFFFAMKTGYKPILSNKEEQGKNKKDREEQQARRRKKAEQIEKNTMANGVRNLKNKARECQQAETNYQESPYLIRKLGKHIPAGIKGLHCDHSKKIIYPLSNIDGVITTYQTISENFKGFVKDAIFTGSFFLLGNSVQDAVDNNQVIWIAEGLATALTGFAAGKKTVLATCSDGNLKIVALAIKEKYPTAIIAGMTDNDCYTGSYAGEKACIAAGIQYVLPDFSEYQHAIDQIEIIKMPTDFNDLLRFGGMEAVKQQLNGIRLVDQRYIDYRMIKSDGITLIKSEMETGKTRAVNDFIRNLSEKSTVLFCSHLIALTKKLAKDGKACLYSETIDGIWSPVNEGDNQYRLATTINSLYKYQNEQLDVFVIDEIESLWRAICTSKYMKAERDRALTALILLIRNAKKVIVIDAHISDITTNFLDFNHVNYDMIVNKYKPLKGATLNIYPINAREQLRFYMQKKLEWGKNIAYSTSGKKNLEDICVPQIKRKADEAGRDINIELFTASTPENSRRNIIDRASGNPEHNLKHINLFGYTNAAGVGISVDKDNHAMDELFGSYCADIMTDRDIVQNMTRFRGLDKYNIAVSYSGKHYETNREKLKKKIFEDRVNISAEIIGTCRTTGEKHVKDDLLMNLWLDVTITDNRAKNDPMTALEATAMEAGMIVNHVENKEGTKILQLKDDKKQREISTHTFNTAVDETPAAGTEEFNKKIEAGEAVNKGIATLKAEVEAMFEPKSEDELNRLTKREHNAGYSCRLKLLLNAYTSLDSYKAMDRAEINRSYSAMDLSHHSARAQYTKKILAFAGIGANLEYNGISWSKGRGAVEKFKTFIRNNKNGLVAFNFIDESDSIDDLLAVDLLNTMIRKIDRRLLISESIMQNKKRFRNYQINTDLLAEMREHAIKYHNYFKAKNSL